MHISWYLEEVGLSASRHGEGFVAVKDMWKQDSAAILRLLSIDEECVVLFR